MKKKNASLKSLLILIILLLTLSTFTSLVLVRYFYKSLKKQEEEFYVVQMETLENTIRQKMRDYYVALRTVGLNSTIRSNIFRTDVSPSDMRKLGSELGRIIRSSIYYLVDDTYMKGCVFYSYLPGDGQHFYSLESAETKQWYWDYQMARKEGKIENGLYISYEPAPGYPEEKISYRMNMIQPINNYYTGYTPEQSEKLCYQVLAIGLEGMVGDSSVNKGMNIHIFEADTQEMIYSNNKNLAKEAREALVHIKDTKRYDNFDSLLSRTSEKPLCIFYVDSMKAYVVVSFELMESNRLFHSGWLAILMILVSYVVLTIKVLAFYKRFRGRVGDVVDFLDRVNVSDVVSAVDPNKPDEILRIERHVNQMQERIAALVKEEYDLKIQKIGAQYEALTACINPHFLYNTLNSIAAMASMEEASDTEDMVIALSDMFRYSTDVHTRYVPLESELKNISDYLYLQGIRYRDTFCYRIEKQQGLENCLVPKLLLQPLVENCFKHGFISSEKDKNRKNEIVIRIVREKEIVRITVIDNGVGFSQERLEEINAQLKCGRVSVPGADVPIGLTNVHRRLQILYGEEYGVTLSCKQGSYTAIEATMIYQKEEENV